MKLTKNYFISEEELVEPLKNSGNHHLYLIKAKKQTFILKKYSTQEPERISREVNFYNFLEKIISPKFLNLLILMLTKVT